MIYFVIFILILTGCTDVESVDSGSINDDSINELMLLSCLPNGEGTNHFSHRKYVPQIGDEWSYKMMLSRPDSFFIKKWKIIGISDVSNNCQARLTISETEDSIEHVYRYSFNNGNLTVIDQLDDDSTVQIPIPEPFAKLQSNSEVSQFECRNGVILKFESISILDKQTQVSIYPIGVLSIEYLVWSRMSGLGFGYEKKLVDFKSTRFDYSIHLSDIDACVYEYYNPNKSAINNIGTLCQWSINVTSPYIPDTYKTTINAESITDPRDSAHYEARLINGKKWIVNDLRFNSAFPDSLNAMRLNRQDVEFRYYANTLASGEYSDENLCPLGWKIPSESEWSALLYAADTIQGLATALIGLNWRPSTSLNLCGFNADGYGYMDDSVIVGESQLVRYWVQSDSIAGRYIEIKHSGHRDFVAEFGTDSIGNTMNLVRCVQDI